ncbi:MAG: serine--tRNA ligase [Candidatus Shikimatogenerans bostrichidophilus]|nr:MAG: serine--tRNA ligase [Candidatus Shikimatogenerans bostrichidophilus]
MLKISYIIKNINKVITDLKNRKFKNLKILNNLLLLYKKNKKYKIKFDKISIIINNFSKNFLKINNKVNLLKFRKIKKIKKKYNKIINNNNIIINKILLLIPNILNKIYYKKIKKNIIYKYIGKNKNKDYIKYYNHIELSKTNDIFDIIKSSEISGSGFVIYHGIGLKIYNALVNYFLDYNNKHGYKEYIVPYLVNKNSLYGTGQLPDKNDQLYKITNNDLYLIPTGEVPLINIYKNKIFNINDLPIKSQTYTHCYRKEAGSYGKKVRGLNRVHEFGKVEIIEIVDKNRSNKRFKYMLNHIKNLLKSLGLLFRIKILYSKDLPNTSSITYDFEVFLLGQKIWLEVSSLSNCLDYQSNNLNIKYRYNNKLYFCHTLNASSLSLPRVLAAIIEYYQYNKIIKIPKILIPYC